jgi:peptidoglycan/xylan/chitin deacetylase (PgdA/CDA1 family)
MMMDPSAKKTPKQRARAAARRVALQGMHAGYRVSGASRRALGEPGVTVLLLHNTPPAQLAKLLAFVDARRDQVVDFGEACDALQAGTLPDRAMIALTFDDGFRSNLDAARALTERGVSACFYVPTDVPGKTQTEVDTFFRRPQAEGVMTWADLEELRDSGHVVGSHCREHLPLSTMDSARAEDQIKGSIEVLRERLGEAGHFAWPFGSLAHAPVADVLRWCTEIDVLAASGVRGRNTTELFGRRGYLSRDAVDLDWIGSDFDTFVTRQSRKLSRVV